MQYKVKKVDNETKTNFLNVLKSNINKLVIVQVDRGSIQFNLEIKIIKIDYFENSIVLFHDKGDLTFNIEGNINFHQYEGNAFELLYTNKDCITFDFI